MSARTLAAHLRRYPWWYALAAVWLVGMLSLPIVHGTALADVFGGDGVTSTTVGSGPQGGAPELASDGGPGVADGDGAALDGGPGTTAPLTSVKPADDDEDEGGLQIVPPEILDAIFDALPPLVVPALPQELDPLFNAIAPIAATGCSGLGLASVVVAVAAQTVDGVPFDRILPYLAPVSTACASFPIPPVHTVCEGDKPLIIDLGGLATTPPILGLGIDELRAFEGIASSSFGVAVPSISDQLSRQLGCTLVK